MENPIIKKKYILFTKYIWPSFQALQIWASTRHRTAIIFSSSSLVSTKHRTAIIFSSSSLVSTRHRTAIIFSSRSLVSTVLVQYIHIKCCYCRWYTDIFDIQQFAGVGVKRKKIFQPAPRLNHLLLKSLQYATGCPYF